MGNRLHIAKIYEVKYADISDFNYKSDTLYQLFSLLQVENFWESDNNDDFEIPRDDFDEKLDYLRNLPDNDPNREEILSLCEQLGYPRPQDLADRLQEFVDASDPRDEYLHFSFF